MTELLTVNEAAELSRVNPVTIRRLLKARKIPGFRVGAGPRSDWRFRRDLLEKWVAERTVAVAGCSRE